jgi:hypothetical protein
MSLRLGITAKEEVKMRLMVADGATWPEVYATLLDVNPDYVRKNLYDPMVAALAPPADSGKPPPAPAK